MARTAPYPADTTISARSNWLRLRTLVLLRWMAIVGQTAAVLMAWRYFDIAVPVAPCLLVVALSVMANLLSAILLPGNHRLSEHEALLVLAFDNLQLAALLYLTGGLNNPFALLILAPTTIAATALGGLSTSILGTMTVMLVSVLAVSYRPLHLEDGGLIAIPRIFGFGFWLAIVIGVAFLGIYARRVTREMHVMSDALLATQMALAREQKLTDLSGIVAAAAHEMGTPLATIMLTSTELANELAASPLLRQDAELIRAQADRCRDILRSMGRTGKDDLYLRSAPFAAVVEEAAEPHRHRGPVIHIQMPDPDAAQPVVRRRPEMIHGLRNLVQNAVDFSNGQVWIDLGWTAEQISFTITDDGPGFPTHLLGKLGDPFMRRPRQSEEADGKRRHYQGMGLGLFIAKTLLERTGASLRFQNATDPFLSEEERPQRCGATVDVRWPRQGLEAEPVTALGENQPIEY